MSKFCPNCGAVADDNAMVCGSCGTPFPAAQQAYQPPVQPGYNPMPGAPVMNQNIPGVTNNGAKKNGVIPKVIAAVLAVVILIVSISAIAGGGKSYKGIVKDFAKAIETGNGKKFTKHHCGGNNWLTKDYIQEDIEALHDKFCDDFDTNKIKVSYKITDTKELSREYVYDEWRIKKAGLLVESEITVKGGGEDDTFDVYLYLVKGIGLKVVAMKVLSI